MLVLKKKQTCNKIEFSSTGEIRRCINVRVCRSKVVTDVLILTVYSEPTSPRCRAVRVLPRYYSSCTCTDLTAETYLQRVLGRPF